MKFASNPVNKKIIAEDYKLRNIRKKKADTFSNSKENYGTSIIVVVKDDNLINFIFSFYDNLDFSRKEMIIGLNNTECNIDNWLNKSRQYSMVRVYLLDYLNLNECIEYCTHRSIYKNFFFFHKHNEIYNNYC